MKVLMVDRLIAEKHHEAVGIRELSEEEAEALDIALSLVGVFNGSHTLFEICQANYDEITNYYESIKGITGFSLYSAHDIVTGMNRLLLNYLSSFRTFIDHQETVLNRMSTVEVNWLDQFKRL